LRGPGGVGQQLPAREVLFPQGLCVPPTAPALVKRNDLESPQMGFFEDIRRVVRRIPRGKVATYGQVARAAGYPRWARMVARALRDSERHRLPWQRVIGSGGAILLPGEAGLRQRLLLELEGVTFRGHRVCIARHGEDLSDIPTPRGRKSGAGIRMDPVRTPAAPATRPPLRRTRSSGRI